MAIGHRHTATALLLDAHWAQTHCCCTAIGCPLDTDALLQHCYWMPIGYRRTAAALLLDAYRTQTHGGGTATGCPLDTDAWRRHCNATAMPARDNCREVEWAIQFETSRRCSHQEWVKEVL